MRTRKTQLQHTTANFQFIASVNCASPTLHDDHTLALLTRQASDDTWLDQTHQLLQNPAVPYQIAPRHAPKITRQII